MKTFLIVRIVADYFIDLFNRSSRDYRKVSSQLVEMKSREKISQQEERIRSQTILDAVKSRVLCFQIHILLFSFIEFSR